MASEANQQKPTARLPLWLVIIGAAAFIGTALLGVRIIWEETVLTWRQGPQMIGFSLAHGSGAILFLFPPALALWTLLVAGLTVRSLVRKTRVSALRWVGLGSVVLVLMLLMMPERFWGRVFIRQMASSPRAADLLVYAAYRGDVGTVRAMLSHGLRVESIDRRDWRTPLHAAAVAGDLPTIRYLVAKGADVNAVDRSGDSPLELAISRNQAEAAKFLVEHGAKRIQGDEAQHQKAINDQVEEDIKEMNRLENR